MNIVTRFNDSYVPEPMTGCWLWEKAIVKGYGQLKVKGKSVKAHRLSYALFVGPIENGLLVCHKCDTTQCVNPEHLFIGTVKDNKLDEIKKGRNHNLKKTHCIAGHEFNEQNTRLRHNQRKCRVCDKIKQKKKRDERKDKES